MTAPDLPDAARSIIKGLIVSLVTAGLISAADAELLIRVLGLGDS